MAVRIINVLLVLCGFRMAHAVYTGDYTHAVVTFLSATFLYLSTKHYRSY